MARAMENLSILNSAVRTFLALVIVGALGLGGWIGYQSYYESDIAIRRTSEELEATRQELAAREEALREKDELLAKKDTEIEDLNHTIEAKDEEIAQLDTKMRLLKVDRRIAHLTIEDQREDPET
ncbi:MAG: hypothetical protein KY475_26785, partial [Planctomycetes bacterium]|nr:hypothetical protein [Planctomycetota bacterium]